MPDRHTVVKKGKERNVCAKAGCGTLIHKSKRCVRCYLVHYCSRECQKADWKVHKPKCNAAVADKAAQDARAKKRSSLSAYKRASEFCAWVWHRTLCDR